MYMLNLLFDLNRSDGVFSGDQAGGVLMVSRNWLKLQAPDPPNLNPEAPPAAWENLGAATGVLLIPNALGHLIAVRIAPIPNMNPPLDPNATLDLVVAFGAPLKAKQVSASPFKGPANQVLTTFISSGPMSSPPSGNPKVGWYCRLGSIVTLPTHPNKVHSYEFTLGAIITSGATVCQYGIDPEMDVSL